MSGTTVSLTLPNDGESIDAPDVNGPFTTLAEAINGGLGDDNIESLTGAKIQEGTLPASAMNADMQTGWIPAGDTLAYSSHSGNREFKVTTSGDKTTKYSPGMRARIARSGTTPTQSATFLSGSSQNANNTSPSGIVFTDDFSCEAWIKLTSYGAVRTIVSRRTSTTNGFQFRIEPDGAVSILGLNSSNFRRGTSRQSIPLNKWIHVAATLDMSSVATTVYIDGSLVPSDVFSTGTPSSLVQSGDLMLGAYTGGSEAMNGQLSEVRVWSNIISSADVKARMATSLTGAESGLVGYWKLNGNFNDSSTNANNLTANSGAVATTSDNPFKALEYAIITAVTYSAPNTTLTLFTGQEHTIPNATLTNFYYSTQDTPYGFPAKNKWVVEVLFKTQFSNSGTQDTWQNLGHSIMLPVGEWRMGYNTVALVGHAGTGSLSASTTLSTGPTSELDPVWTARLPLISASVSLIGDTVAKESTAATSTMITYYLNIAPNLNSTTVYLGDGGNIKPMNYIRAWSSYA